MAVPALDLRKSALVVWDMQEAIAARAYNRAAIVASICELLDGYRSRQLPIVYSQHTTLPNGWANPAMARSMERRGVPAGRFRLTPGAQDWQILTELAPSHDELVLAKTSASFFVGTPLESLLRFRGVETLILAGVSTEGGILSTARHATNLGFHPVVVEDGVGSMSAERQALVLAALREFCDVETTASILARLD